MPSSAKQHYRDFQARQKAKYTRPAIDPDEHPPIAGLEGPFRSKNGRVVHYDPKEGKYYDHKTDRYLDNDESNEMNEARVRDGQNAFARMRTLERLTKHIAPDPKSSHSPGMNHVVNVPTPDEETWEEKKKREAKWMKESYTFGYDDFFNGSPMRPKFKDRQIHESYVAGYKTASEVGLKSSLASEDAMIKFATRILESRLLEAFFNKRTRITAQLFSEGRRLIIKVNAKGKRRKKIFCGRGRQLVGGTRCIAIGGAQRTRMKLAHRKASRTLRRKGSGAKRRSNILRQRANRRRHSMGLRG